MAQNRFPVFPSRMSLQQFKIRTKGARKGHSLLKRKSDALKAKVHACLKEIYDVKNQMNEIMSTANFSHTQATHAAGDFNQKIITKVESAGIKVACRRENVVGVPILQFDKVDTGSSQDSVMGIAKGGVQIRQCKTAYSNALDLLIKLASLQTSFQELDEAMRVTNRRVNALDNVVIPKLENTMHYIASELDEREREDLFRLKKVVAKKKKDAAIAEAYRKGQEKKDRARNVENAPFPGTIIDSEPKSMMDDMNDYEDPEDNIADAF
mmetsp:Transcript_69462/g.62314  ORF Transcript_69462/g.62314 Transcript_69462/m.62314 type:complete len:267 (-) Transcript_69462:271-1071(-)|eukprot:CAMPEP_0201570170 /NCGR_PEP_ID=MMETSP0190_2-20130828/12294_1 /ASSEMBLY_ACC=CAM_ASM_000263 /TAXON_ID=37353 /ORGANISM="Rosalina sp." /LENGTH=266 /DNA_ID=CAMNT_0047993409 /DNA_START=104 /DNA_END=904 /DNA_ORIENTATION=-